MPDAPKINPEEFDGIESAPLDTFQPVSVARLRAWVFAAQPQAKLIYGRGWHLSSACPPDVAEYVRRLHDLGLVTYHHSRAEKTWAGIAYLVMRTKKPVRGAPL
jgi:hypothetical protein